MDWNALRVWLFEPVVDSWENVLVSTPVVVEMVSAIGLVLSVTLPLLFSIRRHANRASKDAAIASSELRNNHLNPDGSPINLRDEMDARHSLLVSLITGIQEDIRAIRAEMSDVRSTSNKCTTDLAELELEFHKNRK